MVDRRSGNRPVRHRGSQSACHELLPAPGVAAASGVNTPAPPGAVPLDLGSRGSHEHYAISCPRCRAVASRRGCQGQPNAPGDSPGLRWPGGEPVLVPWPEVLSAGWPVRPGAVIHLPAEMSLSASSRACVRVPLMGGILPSPLVISPPRSQREQWITVLRSHARLLKGSATISPRIR
jgi:hypothetical protein